MSIHDKDLWGRTLHALAVERLRTYCGGKRVLLAFSGGKDSQVCWHLLKEAGIPFIAQYSVTRFEPPELMGFIRRHYPEVAFRRAYEMSLIEEIEYRGLPNRWARWCCSAKHTKTDGVDIAVIGIRGSESAARRKNWRVFGFKPDKSAYVCPIIDWHDKDVWEYLEGRPHCQLYDEGFARIGCVMCPLAGNKCMARDVIRFPKTVSVLRRGADKYVAKMRAQGFMTANSGKKCSDWHLAATPEDEYWHRWVVTGQTSRPISDSAPGDGGCLFAGTGFSESDGFSDEGGEL
jgi:3''-phosphoadenosine 5''-phosphosulfate sulfotransferase (PAPS reductase)/FAD synthetase and related enzymes